MKRTPTLELAADDPDPGEAPPNGHVPPPLPPDDPEAWYAPDVRAQYELHPGVVATVREREDGFEYDIREPARSPAGERALRRIEAIYVDGGLVLGGVQRRHEAMVAAEDDLTVENLLDEAGNCFAVGSSWS